MPQKFIVFGQPKISEEHIEEVVKTLRSGWIGRGPKVSQFEAQLCEFLNIPYVAALSSCTAALHLACEALGVGEGDEVLVPAMTFGATANAVFHSGAKPVFVDCLKNSPCVDPYDIEKKITKNTKALIVVHMHGERCDMKKIIPIAKKHNLKIIEDAAHGLELPNLGKDTDIVCFSFYPTKNITTIEGGLVASFNKALVDKMKILAQHGLSQDAWKRFSDSSFKHYLIEDLGYKYNMTDVQASLGIHEVPKIRQYRSRRLELWKTYSDELKNTGLILPAINTEEHALHLYAPRIDEKVFKISRDQFVHELHGTGIGCGIHYLSLCEHPFYQRTLNVKPESCPNAYEFGQTTFSVPFSQYLNEQEVDQILDSIKKVCQKNRR